MITLRLPRPIVSFPSLFFQLFKNPLLFLLFVYFFTSSADLFHLNFIGFKVKLTQLIAVGFLGLFLVVSQIIRIPRDFFAFLLAILGAMMASLFNSPYLMVSIGFLMFFVFNYLFYFLGAYNLFRFFRPEWIFRIYGWSFYAMGIYTFCQILLFIGGMRLPGAQQIMASIVRGQGLSYEPSYYALYMTSFAIFCTAKRLFLGKSQKIFWPNFFLLISTSTGCFFSYLFFLLFIVVFRYLNLLSGTHFSLKKWIVKALGVFGAIFSFLWVFNKNLLITGFLKFFYQGGMRHFSLIDRWQGCVKYWEIFLQHPILGVSFGGGPYHLAVEKHGSSVDLADPMILSVYGPMNVMTEVLASVGLLGCGCFCCFFYLLIRSFSKGLKVVVDEEERAILIALALSICVMFATLQFNQSIMRPYLWIHVGIFCGYIQHLREKYRETRCLKGNESALFC